jgi:dGTPase
MIIEAFEKDYHRIISSSSFRRLQDKAQVFPPEKYDFVRTRLTHSMEVASVARSLGNGLIPFIGGKDDCNNISYPIALENK